MGMTPFDGSLLPQDSDLREYAGKKVFNEFDMWCDKARIPGRLVSGPMGSGKTTLVRSYFTSERCRELAEKKKLLVQLCYFSSNQFKNDEDVFLTLIEAVTKSLNNLHGDSETFQRLSRSFQEIREQECYAHIRTDMREGYALLEALAEHLKSEGYRITLIIDDFQHLTCSENCARDTFSNMARLSQNELLSYIVITDLSIRVGSSNYKLSAFERIFGGDPLILPLRVKSRVLTQRLRQHIREAVADMQEDDEEPIAFTEVELDALWALTERIPGLLQDGLKALYRFKEESHETLDGERMEKLLLQSCEWRMKQWIRYFNENYWQTIRAIFEDPRDGSVKARLATKQDRLIELRCCGLIESNSQQTWTFACPLFETFLRTELSRPQFQDTREDVEHLLKGMQESGGPNMTVNLTVQTGTVIHTEGDYVATGASKATFQLLTANDFLNRLGLGGQTFQTQETLPGWTLEGAAQIGERLRSALPPAQIQSSSEQTVDHDLDLIFTESANEILPDVDPESLKDTSLEKLNRKFCSIRSRMGLDADLDDELLNSLSPLCRFYVQAALVVEDHMENIMGLLNDYSTHLVMYGKCLEQSLRDSLFPLLKAHPCFRDYNTYTHYDTPGDPRTFGAMQSETRAMLGGFCHILSQKGPRLASLCAEHHIHTPDFDSDSWSEAEWANWWKGFSQKLYNVKNIRNCVHAGSGAPTRENLADLRRGTFGRSGVLHMCQIGQVLFSEIRETEKGLT